MDLSKPDDLVSAINGHASRLFELQSQILEEARSAAAVAEDDSQAQAAKSAMADAAFEELKSVLGSALEGHEALTTACNSFLKEVGEDEVDIDTATVSNIVTLSSTVVEFVDMIRKAPKKTDGSSVKAVTLASTVISAAKAASHFVPIPGIAVAIGIIDNILANVKDGVDSIGGLKSFLADLKELKTILAPMANQWFSADVRGKCAELVDLLKEVQKSIKAGTSTTGSWFKIVIGSKRAEVEAQMAGYKSRLAKIKELISLAMQVDSAVMLMHTAKKLNLIDTKTDRILQFLRPRTLHLRHDDFLISAIPEDSNGTFMVYKAKMDGSEIIVKEFKHSLDETVSTSIEYEARQWFKLSHANLLPITGICLKGKDDRKPFIAMPYMDCDLKSYLAAHPDLSVHERLRILVCIARGLKYLHVFAPRAPVVHGSLSMSRIHLDSKARRSRSVSACSLFAPWQDPPTAPVMPSTWRLKPKQEAMNSRGFNHVDVYAFGVLAQDVLAQAADQLQPPDNTSADLWQSLQLTLKTCCKNDPDDRPDFSSIVKALAMATRPVGG
ncbi:kinase-like domain-containing protein, partial [Entophlyctis helioformis]